MEDGGWRMEDGGWRMEDGGWRMEDGGGREEGGERGEEKDDIVRFFASAALVDTTWATRAPQAVTSGCAYDVVCVSGKLLSLSLSLSLSLLGFTRSKILIMSLHGT